MSTQFDLLLQEYQEALQKYELGELNRNYLFKLGKPCQVLQENGFLEDDIIMFQKTVRKMIEKHNLSLAQIALLPEQLQNPLAIFISQQTELARIVLTEATHEENPIVVALTPTKLNATNINELKSAYPKEKWVLTAWSIKNLKIWGKEKE